MAKTISNVKKEKFTRAARKVQKGILSGLLVFNLFGSPAAQANSKTTSPKSATHTTINAKNQDKLTAPIKITSQRDIETLFSYALPIIFAELILEEVPMSYVYDDYGLYAGKANTGGTGSTYMTVNVDDYNNPKAKWFHVAGNPKTFKNRTFSYEDMLKYDIGWGQFRTKTQNPKTKETITHATVLKRMFMQLKGIELTPNEFSALYCAVYNNENNIKVLLPKIKRDYQNKIKCANHIRQWCGSTASNKGTAPRCLFESLVFLNTDDFCNAMLEMPTCPASRASCIYATNATQYCDMTITAKNYKTISDKCKRSYLSQVYRNRTVVTPTIAMSGLGKYFVTKITPTINANDMALRKLQQDYDHAIKLYNQGKYSDALQEFLDLQKRGADGPDLLNDIAVAYLNTKQYDDCIATCRKILKTTQYNEYAKACYNAGKAYEALGDTDGALRNYTQALEHYNKYGVSREDKSINYANIYTDAINRIKTQTSTEKATEQTTPTKSKNKTARNLIFILGAAAVTKKGYDKAKKHLRKRHDNNR